MDEEVIMKRNFIDIIFSILNYTLTTLFTIACIYPFYYIFINTLSSPDKIGGTDTLFIPVGLTLQNYYTVLRLQGIAHAFLISLLRTATGTALTIFLSSMFAYVLTIKRFRFRGAIYKMMVLTMYINAGLIPWYILMKAYGLKNNFLLYILPAALSPFLVILVKTYIEQIPPSLEESAKIDGAGYFTIYSSIIFPVCTPVIAAIAVFAAVAQWNSWFDNYILANISGLRTLQLTLLDYLKQTEAYLYQDIAILYRTNAQSRVMEDQLRKNFIPYRIYGGLSFYQRKEIKDVIAYCRLICNPADEEALKRIINTPARGIGDTTVNKLIDCASLHTVTAWEVMGDMLKYNLPVNAGTANKLAGFREMIRIFAAQREVLNAYQLMETIIKTTGIISDTYHDHSPESMSRRENVQELLNAVHEFCETKTNNNETALLTDFLSEVSLLTDQDTDKDENKDKVTMMTVHAAKGLEFKVVFIVGMEEELFPSVFSMDNAKELEEERRLFYVAITRAEERCFISFAKSRFKNGQVNFSNPSRFIKDIDPVFLDQPAENPFRPGKNLFDDIDEYKPGNVFRHKQYDAPKTYIPKPAYEEKIVTPKRLKKIVPEPVSENSENYHPSIPTGKFVKHQLFGIGKVLTVSMNGANEKAEIDFGEKGVKSLLLKFAKLEIME